MFEYLDLDPSTHRDSYDELVEALEVLAAGLTRYFTDSWFHLEGHAIHVDEILENLERYVAQVERTRAAFDTWLEEGRFLRDELRSDVLPLVAGIRRFIIDEFGADSPLIRELGFEPVPRRWDDDEDDDDGEDEDDDRLLCQSRVCGRAARTPLKEKVCERARPTSWR